jgi:hypothetical protein
MKIKRNFSASTLFDHLPNAAIFGLALAGLSALMVFLQGVTTLLSISQFYYDFRYLDITGIEQDWQTGLFWTIISLLTFVAIYLATGPRQLARITVISIMGAKLLLLVTTNSLIKLPNIGSQAESEVVFEDETFDEMATPAVVDQVDISSMTLWQFMFLFLLSAIPIALLLTRACNNYYSRK